MSRRVKTKEGNVKSKPHHRQQTNKEKKSNGIRFHYKRLKTNAIKAILLYIGRKS
jgi:hypothetical protein